MKTFTTTATAAAVAAVLRPLYRTEPQLRTGGFYWRKVLVSVTPYALTGGNWHIRHWETMPEFLSSVLPVPSPYLLNENLCFTINGSTAT